MSVVPSSRYLPSYFPAYVTGGLEPLQHLEPRRPRRALHPHRATIAAEFCQHPPATVAEAAARIQALTGIIRKPTQVRQFLNRLGMRPRRVGVLPAKAGQRAVFFMDAAHFVLAPFVGMVWCVERLFVKAPSGRQRVNVLAALNDSVG